MDFTKMQGAASDFVVVDIELPGGVLNAEWNGNGEVVPGGPAEVVFEGKWLD